MAGRWRILALLFCVRTTMAFQFQIVGALGPLIRNDFAVGTTELGLLIGLYLSPGILLALPAGGLGRRFGDQRCVLLGLGLMMLGGVVMALAPGWNGELAGRVIAGLGGVILNVLMAKMVTDWFAGPEIATAMGIYVNSWPFGIALALFASPLMAGVLGLGGTFLLTAAAAAVGLLLMTAYRSPAALPRANSESGVPGSRVAGAILVAGAIWGLFNGAMAMIFSFGNSMLVERGWTLTAAGGATSLVLWLVVVSVPLGGLLADRSGRPGAVLVGGCLGFALILGIARNTAAVLPSFVALGLVCGLPAGPIMSLPARVLSDQTRAIGMGIFWTMFYLVVVGSPWLAGRLAGFSGNIGTTFDLGIAMLLLACVGYGGFMRLSSATLATPGHDTGDCAEQMTD